MVMAFQTEGEECWVSQTCRYFLALSTPTLPRNLQRGFQVCCPPSNRETCGGALRVRGHEELGPFPPPLSPA